MATKKTILEETVPVALLAKLIENYWKTQRSGLKLGSGSNRIRYQPIREWFATRNIEVSDAEIVDAHRLFLDTQAKNFPGLSVTVTHVSLDDRDHFCITFGLTILLPAQPDTPEETGPEWA